MNLPDSGLIAVVKRDCQTCEMTEPVLAALADAGALTVYTQDDPTFPESVPHEYDKALNISHRLKIEVVPTLLRREGGREIARTFGWNKAEWRKITGVPTLGEALPDLRPGCGAKNIEPGIIEDLLVRHGETGLQSRRVALGAQEDEIEALFERGWSDGLPVVPPTEARVLRMLAGTARDAKEVIGKIPSDLVDCTVEKVAVNAVMAGCKPEYLPVVIAAVEAVLEEPFSMHGVLATTMFVGPVVIVNGPIRRSIGMNAKGNALGQGFRANSTIGRALQLVIRNVGGGRPQEVDRATLGNPGKLTCCIAEDEEDSCWESLATERGIAEGKSAVTVFAGYGLQGIVDQRSRDPESLAQSFAACLKAVQHPKLYLGADALVVVCPEHERTFRQAGWTKARLYAELYARTESPAEEVMPGAGGIAEGTIAFAPGTMARKFREGGLMIVRAGGGAGMFSGIIGG
ncbi:MAG TPA: thioredoxin, partial [Hyphomicrobiaceae bacterium]|nr:thioredoxin [Hyphomicrobiaceae bacterium]